MPVKWNDGTIDFHMAHFSAAALRSVERYAKALTLDMASDEPSSHACKIGIGLGNLVACQS